MVDRKEDRTEGTGSARKVARKGSRKGGPRRFAEDGDMSNQNGELAFRGRNTGSNGRAAARHPPGRRKFVIRSRPREVRRRKPTGYPGPFRVPLEPGGACGLHSKLERVLI